MLLINNLLLNLFLASYIYPFGGVPLESPTYEDIQSKYLLKCTYQFSRINTICFTNPVKQLSYNYSTFVPKRFYLSFNLDSLSFVTGLEKTHSFAFRGNYNIRETQILLYAFPSKTTKVFIEKGSSPRLDRKADKLVYQKNNQIIVMDLTTSQSHIVADTGYTPDISPDGTCIIYTRNFDGREKLILADTLGQITGTYNLKGDFEPKFYYIHPYPYFVSNDKLVYRAYSEDPPFKSIYLQNLGSNNTREIVREYKTHNYWD